MYHAIGENRRRPLLRSTGPEPNAARVRLLLVVILMVKLLLVNHDT